MMNVCENCGQYRADKIIDPSGPYAICPECGHKHAFVQLPLPIVSGASGAGKSAVCRALLGTMDEVVLLEGDIFNRWFKQNAHTTTQIDLLDTTGASVSETAEQFASWMRKKARGV